MVFLVLISIVFLLLSIYTIRSPSVAMVSVWCMYAIEQWTQGSSAFFIRHNSLINIVVCIVVLLAVIIKFVKYRHVFKDYPKIALPILLLFAYSFISVMWVQQIEISIGIWSKYWPYLIAFLLLAPLLLTTEAELKIVFNIFIIVGGIAVYALLFHVEWFHRRIVFVGGRYNSELLGNPLAVAQMAGYLFFVCMFMFRKSTGEKFNYLFGIIKLLVGAVCILLIIKSGSRGQLLGLVLTFLLFIPLVYKLSSFKGFVLVSIFSVLVVFAIVWGLDEFWGKSSRWNQAEMESSMGGRLDNAFVLLEHWYKNPLTVIAGLGNSASYNPKILGIYPHFVPFEILGEEGLIGFFIYIFILISITKIGFRLYKKTKGNVRDRQYFTILLAMVFYSFFLSLKQGSLLGNMEFFMAAMILGKYELILKNNKKRDK